MGFGVFGLKMVNVPSNIWWLDTGTTIHVTNSLQALRNVRKPSDGKLIVWLENDDKVEMEHIGDISLCLSTKHILELKKHGLCSFYKKELNFSGYIGSYRIYLLFQQ